jgi:hypothetical protein
VHSFPSWIYGGHAEMYEFTRLQNLVTALQHRE